MEKKLSPSQEQLIKKILQHRQADRLFYENNKDKIKQRTKEYYHKNRDAILEKLQEKRQNEVIDKLELKYQGMYPPREQTPKKEYQRDKEKKREYNQKYYLQRKQESMK